MSDEKKTEKLKADKIGMATRFFLMMMGIQLGALASYGRLTRKQLKELIATLNA